MITFYRKSDDFSDILSDPILKKVIRVKLSCYQHLFISLGWEDDDDKIQAYINLKYGDSIISFDHIAKDRTPVMNKDYMPEPRKKVLH